MSIENLALRQQVAVFKQSVKRPKLRPRDRLFWVLLSRLWRNSAIRPGDRAARNRHQVAPKGLSVVLAMEIAGREARPPAHQTGNP
jgi:hypothetical protein